MLVGKVIANFQLGEFSNPAYQPRERWFDFSRCYATSKGRLFPRDSSSCLVPFPLGSAVRTRSSVTRAIIFNQRTQTTPTSFPNVTISTCLSTVSFTLQRNDGTSSISGYLARELRCIIPMILIPEVVS